MSIKDDQTRRRGSVLGANFYEKSWLKVQDDFSEEQARARTNAQRFAYPWAKGLRDQLQADLAFAEKVSEDYFAFLERVSARGEGTEAERDKISDVFVLAISVLTLVNDVFDDIFGLGIASLLSAIATASLNREAKIMEEDLKKLIAELKRARREVKEAWAQLALDGVVTIGLALSGPLGWLTLGAVGLGQMVADTYLGPATSDAATWGNRANTTLGTAVSASGKYLEKGSKTTKFLKPAGRVIIVVGVAFDINELGVGYSNIDVLKKVMAETKKAQDVLIAKVIASQAHFSSLSIKIDNLKRQVEQRGNGWTAETRATLDHTMKRLGYR